MVDPGIVLVVDNDERDRSRTARILRSAGFHTREANGGEAALAAMRQDEPAAVVVDVSLDGITGYELCRRIRDIHGDEIGVVFVSAERTEPIDRVAGLLLGADDYLAKPFLADELTARVLRLVRRRGWRNGSHDDARPSGARERSTVGRRNGSHRGASNGTHGADGMPRNGARRPEREARPYQLTERELEVLSLLADGLDQVDMARELFVSTTTVATHIQRILGKLGVHNRAQAVAVAHREGLVGQG